jgi:3'-phosphoadenosine 5'-phosphosulfate sulfotransferase (PAPS reductase)/FAD synthetase
MTEIVLYSMGIASAYIACRLQDECHKPVCLWSDTKREDEDTYRFGREVAERWDLNVVEASHGGDLWDTWAKQNFIPARQLGQCSKDFKIIPSRAYLDTLEQAGASVRVAYGYDMDEQKRADRTLSHWDYKAVSVWFPLIEWGVSKQQCFGYFHQHGIKPARMYAQFQHSNCLPCKNFREKDWLALAYHYPEKFAEAAAFELKQDLRWMQDGPKLIELAMSEKMPSRQGRRNLAGEEPAFSFDQGCDRCAIG